MESPVSRVLLPPARAAHCSLCWAVVPAPLPCPVCTAALHCGLQCRAGDARHTLLCGLEDLLDMAGEEAKLVLDMFITFGLQQFLALPKQKDQKLGVTSAGIKYRPDDLINAFTKFGRPEDKEGQHSRVVDGGRGQQEYKER